MTAEKKNELALAVINADTSCPEIKEAAKAYLEADEKDKAEKAKLLIQEAKEDIGTIDGAIEFLKSDFAKSLFGEEETAKKLAHAVNAKENGAVYCACSGCNAAKDLIENEAEFLA